MKTSSIGKCVLSLSALVMVLGASSGATSQPELQLWSVDALVKVFPDDKPAPAAPAPVEVARGEHASFQVVVRSDSAIQGLHATVSEFKRTGASGALAPRSPRFVGYVPVDRPTQKPSQDQLRKPPADYPDPLLEVWFYTCVFPQGEYANRFIEQPLIKTRLLHWINFRYGVTGYLHWGYNHWTQDSPFTHTTRAHGGPPYLPAGDPWIVYPGKDGPLDSIRFEAMRDGIADYELLCLVAEKNPEAAQRLVRRHVLEFARYETDIGQFRSARRELLQLAAEFTKDTSR